MGPAGEGTSTVRNVELASTNLSAAYEPVNPTEDTALFELLQELNAPDVLPRPVAAISPEAPTFEQLVIPGPGSSNEQVDVAAVVDGSVALVSSADSWVRVRAADGSVVFEGIISPGAVQDLPVDAQAPTMRAGNSGALYARVGAKVFGPMGDGAVTVRNVDMTAAAIQAAYPQLDAAKVAALGLAN